jgi:hypothetical protein
MGVVRLSALATLLELEAGWALELVWMFFRRDSSLALAEILTAHLPVYIPVIVLTVLPHTGLKIMQNSLLIN